MGDFLAKTLQEREVLDIFYFMVVMTIMLNVCTGVVIDTFGSLRSKRDERIERTENYCFICGIHRSEFDRSFDGPGGFQHHFRFDHNMWNYFKFIVYIWEQDQDDDDGLEQMVRRGVRDLDLGWFPMNRAMCLNEKETEEERMHKELKGMITQTQESISAKVRLEIWDIAIHMLLLSHSLTHKHKHTERMFVLRCIYLFAANNEWKFPCRWLHSKGRSTASSLPWPPCWWVRA